MQATIKLKDGEYIRIDKLKLIRQHETNYLQTTDFVDFENFKLYQAQYTFVGNTILLLNADDIVYITFDHD